MSFLLSVTKNLSYLWNPSVSVLKYVGVRLLSVNETAIALRPFIFTVHPDLFGRFPREQSVNEESLKRLNEHINNLHIKRNVSPLTLTFYVRNGIDANNPSSKSQTRSSSGNFRAVHIRLIAQNLRDTIKAVLTACGLPLDYLDSVSVSSSRVARNLSAIRVEQPGENFTDGVNATILHRFYGMHTFDQSQIRVQKMARDPLCKWLLKNVDRGRKNALQMAPVRQEIAKLKEMIMEETGVVDIQWQCSWTLSSFRTALRGLLRVCRQYASDLDLKGRTIIFGTNTGVCIQGHVILRHDDVPDHWIVTLKTVYQYSTILTEIPTAERCLSKLLGGINVARQPHHPVMMAQDYLRQVLKLIASIHEERDRRASGRPIIHVDVRGVQLAIECATGSLMVTHCGQILVPSSCPAFLIIDFINMHAAESKRIWHEFLSTEKSHISVVEDCYAKLGVESLTCDANVSRTQMDSCCRRLLKLVEMGVLTVDLTTCHLQITQFYSVMSDGDICIPWNFEDLA